MRLGRRVFLQPTYLTSGQTVVSELRSASNSGLPTAKRQGPVAARRREHHHDHHRDHRDRERRQRASGPAPPGPATTSCSPAATRPRHGPWRPPPAPGPPPRAREAVAGADIVVLAVPYTAVADDRRRDRPGRRRQDRHRRHQPAQGRLLRALDRRRHLRRRGARPPAARRPRSSRRSTPCSPANAADPQALGFQLDSLFATDDEAAKDAVCGLSGSIGFRPIHVGPLAAARELEAMAWLNIRLQLISNGNWNTAYALVSPPEASPDPRQVGAPARRGESPGGARDSALRRRATPTTVPPSRRPTEPGATMTRPLPALYLGHGAPPLLDDPLWMAQLAGWSAELPRPKAVLIVSAHWQTAPDGHRRHHDRPARLRLLRLPAALLRPRVPRPGRARSWRRRSRR